MAGKSVSGYVDESVAARLGAVAAAEARTPASLVGQATSFYVGLPEMARSALRSLEQSGTPEERRWFEGEFVRLLLKAKFAITQRAMAEQVGPSLPADNSDEAIEAATQEWLGATTP
ncbi:hypothetical protein [Methylorubrum thiocyanatum]|uniref:Uncharacterized protein n=1 Tax=Methylorubrum thiocyanatum TaxID=47958 RepID=A0AA40S4W5_9HYPH|nr:hypothetical protein [Methylorubrum thiocyanatum]MBA8914618.1 hypothetical protein [Methylorubrum thiocyanatum]GJE81969.1 hypothetical protein CJNNKLLH_3326 [Methylorubrum thiocyanatum]